MKEFKRVFVLILLLSIFFLTSAPAEFGSSSRIKGRFGFGLNYPGIVLKYGISNRLALDFHTQFALEPAIIILGPRLWFYLNPASQAMFYFGPEANYVIYGGEAGLGRGYILAGVAGLEVFLSNRISFLVEISPGWLSLKNDWKGILKDYILERYKLKEKFEKFMEKYYG